MPKARNSAGTVLSEFKANGIGKAQLILLTEFGNAFTSANQSFEDELGIADVPGAGAIANGANTIELKQ